MPVVIRDFEVVGNGNGAGPAPEAGPSQQQAAERPLSARQVAKMMAKVKERARRLYAD